MKKILIVDDSLFMRKVLYDILLTIGIKFQILEAQSGKTALDIFRKENPDLTLLDIIMPGGEEEGVKVLRRVMEIDPKAKVIMITAVGQDLIMEECKRIGAKDYVVKPFNENQIVETVEKHLIE